MQRSFVWNGLTITIHRERVADELDAELLIALLLEGIPVEPRAEWLRHYHRAGRYADFLVSVDRVEGAGDRAAIPAVTAAADEVKAGFTAFLAASGLYRAWQAARALANAPVGDIDTSPGADPNE